MDTAKIIKNGKSEKILQPVPCQEDNTKHGAGRITLEEFFALPCCPDFEIDRTAGLKVQERDIFK